MKNDFCINISSRAFRHLSFILKPKHPHDLVDAISDAIEYCLKKNMNEHDIKDEYFYYNVCKYAKFNYLKHINKRKMIDTFSEVENSSRIAKMISDEMINPTNNTHETDDLFDFIYSQLTLKQLEVFHYHYFEGYTLKEIAEFTNSTESAIKRRNTSVKCKIRKLNQIYNLR